ncbi:MAG: hypothetical protein R3E82_13790 [Pseudomonadales bacterium]|nr:hypothetical protein [Pseudomonadales bacterium]
MKPRTLIRAGVLTAGLLATSLVLAQTAPASSLVASPIVSSDKGGFQYSEPPAFPELYLDLAPVERAVAAEARQYCATPLAAAPLDLGDADSFMSEVMGKAAGAVIGQLVGGLFGGGGSKEKPDLYKDPIRNKYKQKIAHPSGDARIRIGGQAYEDGLLMSAKVDKAAGQGTFHTMFLEMPDCTRIWPEQYLGYDLWGSWSLSVSVTKTSSSYRNGELVDRSVSQSSWSKSGDFDFSRGFSLWDQIPGEAQHMILQGDQAYLSQLRREIDVPAWQAMGFGEPTEGIRSAGGLFRVAPEDLAPGTIAVVHITHVDKGRYRTVGFPLQFEFVEDGRMQFEQMAEAQD